MNWYKLSTIIAAVISLGIGGFVYLRNRKNPVNLFFGLLSLSISFWCLSSFIISTSLDPESALFYGRFLHIPVIFMPPIWLVLIFSIIGEKIKENKVNRSLLIGTLALSPFFTILSFTDLLLSGVSQKFIFANYFLEAGIFYLPFALYWTISAGYGFVKLFTAFWLSKGNRRTQLKYFFVATFIGASAAIIYFMLVFGMKILPVADSIIIFYLLIMAYAIVKHRLMEIEFIIKKTLIFAGLFTFVSMTFVGITFLVQEFLSGVLGENTRWAVFIFSIGIITVGMRPLEHWLVRLTDRFLFQKKYDYQKTLREASEGMTLVTDMKKLLNLIVRVVTKSVRVRSAAIFQFDEARDRYVLKIRRGMNRRHTGYALDKDNTLVWWLRTHREAILLDEVEDWLRSERFLRKEKGLKDRLIKIKEELEGMDAAICVPSYGKGYLVGFLVLGEKLSGDVYTQEDIHLLSTLASEAAIAVENAKNFMELQKLREKERESYVQTVLALAQTVDEKDSYTHGHLEDVAFYGMRVAEELEESSEFNASMDKEDLETALQLHDIGKIGVPDAILNKNGKLTAAEWEIMKQHCEIGSRIVEPIGKLRNVGNIIKHHQEKYDGSGYPDGLKGEEIPLEARIIAVVDSYHAMTSDRPYRKALSQAVAMKELRDNTGTQFDPIVVAAFVRAWEKGKIKKL